MNPAVIFDNGSGSFKAGLGDDDAPRVVFPTIVGKPKNPSLMVGMDQKDSYVGAEAQQKRNLLYISNPIEHGHIVDWDAMEKIWSHTYENELVVDATEHPIMLTEPPANNKADRVKLMTTFFETYQVQHFNLSVGAVLALYASGRTTGIVVDSGDGVTHTVPVYEGFSLPFATMKIELAGRDLTEYLQKLLQERNFDFSSSNDREEVEKIKEKKCRVAYDFDAAIKESQEANPKEVIYTLPDGTNIN